MRHRALKVAFGLVACLLVLAGPASAAGPDDYLAEMPPIDEVIAKVQGSDASDTAARQYTAFNRLESMMNELIGDRFATNEMTEAEQAARRAYHDNYLRIQSEVLASFPEDQREVRPDSRYGQWRALVNTYFASPEFNDGFLDTFFSASFRAMYEPIHTKALTTSPWVGFTDPVPTEPARDWTWVYVGIVAVSMLVGAFGTGRYRRRSTD